MAVSLASLKAHLNITDDTDNELLTDKLAAASAWIAAYTGGEPGASDIPSPVEEATRQLAAHLYENREATLIGITAQTLPFGMLDLLAPCRAWAF
jgi:hypothetical protein